jgi:hypothetical protein
MQVAKHKYEEAFQMALFIEAGGCEFDIPDLNDKSILPPGEEIEGTCIGYLAITTPLQEASKRLDEEMHERWRWEDEAKRCRNRANAAFRRADRNAELAAKKGAQE